MDKIDLSKIKYSINQVVYLICMVGNGEWNVTNKCLVDNIGLLKNSKEDDYSYGLAGCGRDISEDRIYGTYKEAYRACEERNK